MSRTRTMNLHRATAISLLVAAFAAVTAEAQTVFTPADAPPGARLDWPERQSAPGPAVQRLRADLDGILAAADAVAARFSVLVTSLDTGDTLFARSPDLPLAPASNMKLYTTAAALYYLGPEFRYSTQLLIDGEVDEGVLHGDVILRGTGDPSLSERLLGDPLAPLSGMADALEALGVRVIAGDVVGDGSWFDEAWLGPEWEEDDRMSWYAAPIGGLTFGESMVRIRVSPGDRVGDPARITTVPGTRGLKVRNEVGTVAGGATRVTFGHAPDGIVVTGTVRRGHAGVERRMPVVDPANFAAAALRAVLEDRGTIVEGRTRSGAIPGRAARVVAEHLSPPLLELATVTNHVSHNLFAEALLKTVGRTVRGDGAYAAGAEAVREFLRSEMPSHAAAVAVVDGSGLSRRNRATAGSTIALLEHLARSGLAAAFLESLPTAGQQEGLRRMYDSPAADNLRAKTGTIRGVSALSGYLTTAEGERLAFSIISNGLSAGWRAKALEDRIAIRLAAFTR